jgi:hypothetical protein
MTEDEAGMDDSEELASIEGNQSAAQAREGLLNHSAKPASQHGNRVEADRAGRTAETHAVTPRERR